VSKLTEYRVTMWPRHGPTHNLYLEAPDAYTAREYAMRMCPDQKVIGIRRIEDLKKDGLA
jgi:hypothetical protein